MNLQKEIIAKFYKQYPDATLKELSSKAGIQITRVFRIMNGYEMKISEYEKIHQLIQKKDLSETLDVHLETYKEYLTELSDQKRYSLIKKYQHHIELRKLTIPLSALPQTNNIEGGFQDAQY